MLWRVSSRPVRTRSKPPGFILPCQPALAGRPPSGPDWLHEIKFDGYRVIAPYDCPSPGRSALRDRVVALRTKLWFDLRRHRPTNPQPKDRKWLDQPGPSTRASEAACIGEISTGARLERLPQYLSRLQNGERLFRESTARISTRRTSYG